MIGGQVKSAYLSLYFGEGKCGSIGFPSKRLRSPSLAKIEKTVTDPS